MQNTIPLFNGAADDRLQRAMFEALYDELRRAGLGEAPAEKLALIQPPRVRRAVTASGGTIEVRP